MKVALLNEQSMVTGFKTEPDDYTVVVPGEHDVTAFNPQPVENDFILSNSVVKPIEIGKLENELISAIRLVPNLHEHIGQLAPNEFPISHLNPKPDVGWRIVNPSGIASFEPNTKIHKAYFINRLKPWWADIKAARATSQELDNDFEMFNEYTHVDFAFPDTQMMIPRLVAEVLAVNPESTITQEAIQAPVTYYEAYRPNK